MHRRACGLLVLAKNPNKKIQVIVRGRIGNYPLEFAVRIGAAIWVLRLIVDEIGRLAIGRRAGPDFHWDAGDRNAGRVLEVDEELALGMRLDDAINFDELHAGHLRAAMAILEPIIT